MRPRGWEICRNPGITLVAWPNGATFSPLSAAAISSADEKRSSTVSSMARNMAASVADEMDLFKTRGGWNAVRLAMRFVAVGGAWPVSAW
jgi:hypothetical protein